MLQHYSILYDLFFKRPALCSGLLDADNQFVHAAFTKLDSSTTGQLTLTLQCAALNELTKYRHTLILEEELSKTNQIILYYSHQKVTSKDNFDVIRI